MLAHGRASMNEEPLLSCALYKGQTHKKLHVGRVGVGLLKYVAVSSWLKYLGIFFFHIMRWQNNFLPRSNGAQMAVG